MREELTDFAIRQEYERIKELGDKLVDIGNRMNWEGFRLKLEAMFKNNNIAQSDRVAATTRYCQDSGGRVESVHTPYGDVDLCAFPDGRSVNLWALYNRAGGDPWRYYAYSWLNGP